MRRQWRMRTVLVSDLLLSACLLIARVDEEEDDDEDDNDEEIDEAGESANSANATEAARAALRAALFAMDSEPSSALNRPVFVRGETVLYYPTISILLQFDHVMTQRVLQYMVEWLVQDLGAESVWEGEHGEARAYYHCAWIYGLLARLERPLHRDMLAHIRHLGKAVVQCCGCSSHAGWRVLLCLVDRCFGQAHGLYELDSTMPQATPVLQAEEEEGEVME